MSNALRATLACAFGAFIGSLIAIEQGWYMLLGSIVGGITAYIVADLQGIWRAAKHISKKIIEEKWDLLGIDWQNVEATWYFGFWYWLYVSLVMISWAIGLGVMIGSLLMALDAPKLWMIIGIISVSCPIGVFLAQCGGVWFDYEPDDMKTFFLETNFLTVYMRAIAKVIRDIAWTIPRIPRFMAITTFIIIRIIANIVIEIHSGLRIQCLADGAIGALIGGAFGSYLYGAIAGGLFGLLNYLALTRHVLDTRFINFDNLRL